MKARRGWRRKRRRRGNHDLNIRKIRVEMCDKFMSFSHSPENLEVINLFFFHRNFFKLFKFDKNPS